MKSILSIFKVSSMLIMMGLSHAAVGQTEKAKALGVPAAMSGGFNFKQICRADEYPSIRPFPLARNSAWSNVYSVNHLPGLFCRMEYKIELKSKLAPRFRLGSLQYTEWMEGKRPYIP